MARELTIPWMAAVLRQRLTGGRKLAPINQSDAWLADTQTFDIAPYGALVGDRRAANGLPDERVPNGCGAWLAQRNDR